MAESPLSPSISSRPIDLHTGAVSETSSTASTDANSMEVNFNQSDAGIDLQCPATPQMSLKLPYISSSSSESEADDPELGTETRNGLGGAASSRHATSPPPNCAICLGRCKNKCFTDSCMHQFCFKCLCEWSKVKPECPLCKQTFKSIIHNVKSIDQFEEYHVQPPTVQIPHRPVINFAHRPIGFIGESIPVGSFELPRPRWIRSARALYVPPLNAPTSAGPRDYTGTSRLAQSFREELLDRYRQEHPDAVSSSVTLSGLWRRYVYDRKLYALPVCDVTGRYRETSARFYRDNPAQIHRLMPWINRDIVCLLRNTEHDVSSVLERINETLTVLNIQSPGFRRRLQQYLSTNTSHFIHELQNFARSPYDMIGYDRVVQYAPHHLPEDVVIGVSSTSSDEGSSNSDFLGPRVRGRPLRNLTEYRMAPRSTNSGTSQNSLVTFTISTTSEGVESPGVTVALGGRAAQSAAINLSTHNRTSEMIINLDDTEVNITVPNNNPNGPSTSSQSASFILNNDMQLERNGPTPPTENIEISSDSSDECEFVLERKPPHLRTPEMVSLNSESDSDVVFVEETKVLEATAFSSSDVDSKAQQSTGSPEGRTTRSVVKNEEAFNVGASTSAGLVSTGRKRRQASLDADKRRLRKQQRPKKMFRSKSKVRKQERPKKMFRGKFILSESSQTSDSTSSDSDDEDYGPTNSRKRPRKDKFDKKRFALSSRKNRESGAQRKRPSQNSNKNKTKRRKVAKSSAQQSNSDSEYESEENQSLLALKQRLTSQSSQKEVKSNPISKNSKLKSPAKQEQTCQSSTENSSSACDVSENMARRESEELDSDKDSEAASQSLESACSRLRSPALMLDTELSNSADRSCSQATSDRSRPNSRSATGSMDYGEFMADSNGFNLDQPRASTLQPNWANIEASSSRSDTSESETKFAVPDFDSFKKEMANSDDTDYDC